MNIVADTVNPQGHTPSANGVTRASVEGALAQVVTEGYRPALPLWVTEGEWLPQVYLIRDIELMLTHPTTRNVLSYYKAGVSGAEFWGGPTPGFDGPPDADRGLPVCDDPAVGQQVSQFVLSQCMHYWQHGVPQVQFGYDYGWFGGENVYGHDGGQFAWEGVLAFHPRDTFLLTSDQKPVGVRVKGVTKARQGQEDLWLSSEVPSKGLWYAHSPRYNRHYGQSQLFGAWRPWRRLAYKDGAEPSVDQAIYRHAYAGPIGRFPEEDMQIATQGSGPSVSGTGFPNTTLDSQGRPRRWARDQMRQIVEQTKAGAGVALPSTQYPPEWGGGNKWDIDFPGHALDPDPLVNYCKYLEGQVSYGIGVAPELLQAAETGSGYSGRNIPFEAFLAGQQRVADALLRVFVVQVLRPLVRWNFGAVRWRVQVKDLLQSKRKRQATGQAAPATGAPSGGNGETRVGRHGAFDGRPPLPVGAADDPNAPQDVGQGKPGWAAFSLSDDVMEMRARWAILQAIQAWRAA